MRSRIGRFVLMLIVAASAVVLAGQAQADFKICNKSKFKVTTAFGYKESGQWTSEGWWTIDPGQCRTVYSKNLSQQYYYYYAESTDGEWTWSDTYIFCAADKAFKISGDKDCKSRGYDAYGFKEVDVGEAIEKSIDLTADNE